jgi:hypothetical protein
MFETRRRSRQCWHDLSGMLNQDGLAPLHIDPIAILQSTISTAPFLSIDPQSPADLPDLIQYQLKVLGAYLVLS